MNYEVFALIPPDGHVIEIFTRCGKIDFAVGFCRQIIVFGKRVEFMSPFRRATNVAMTASWAERTVFETCRIGQYSFEFSPEQNWMLVGEFGITDA